jgi:hypothetical protein
MFLWSAANALVILTLDNDGSPSYQQQASSPCVIGGPSCNSTNPPTFLFNDINADDNDGTVTFAESTQTYLVSQVTGIVGNKFIIGIDTGQSGNANTVSNWLQLQTFDVLINGVVQFQYNVAAPGTPVIMIHGNGFSDAFLTLVDLSTFTFIATDTITFRTLYNNATNGPDSFFLINSNATPVPEPGTLLLLGSALAALGGFARRKGRTGVQS